jgi:molybdopterin converting factor small subunit
MDEQIRITIRLIGAFRINRFKEREASYPCGIRVEAIVDELQIPRRALGTVLINGLHARTTDQPKEGDIVALLPILGGG